MDGHKYLEQAAASGAGAALVEDVPEVCPDGLTLLKVADTRLGMEVIAPFFYDYPGKTMRMIGVTGTNGKTTTTNIVRAILRKAGFKVGLIGTINIMIEDEAIVAHKYYSRRSRSAACFIQNERSRMRVCGHGGFVACTGT